MNQLDIGGLNHMLRTQAVYQKALGSIHLLEIMLLLELPCQRRLA